MAIRSIAQLKAWFKRGAYPTAEQFADWIDSFFHKEEKIPISSIDGLPDRLNAKYDRTSGEELERRQTELEGKFDIHSEENVGEFANVYRWLKEKDEIDDQTLADLETVHADISGLQEDVGELRATDEELKTDLTNAQNDIGTIREMLKGGATLAQAKAALVALGSNYQDLYAVANTLKTFLQSKDTAATTINTWQEIEGFLQGITDTQSLTTLLSALETKITAAYNTAIAAAVKTEKDRATAAESGLSQKVDQETTRAQGAETALGDRITQAQTALAQADDELRLNISEIREEMGNMGAFTPNPIASRWWNEDNSTPTAAGWYGDLDALRDLPQRLGLGRYLVTDNRERRKLDPTNSHLFEDGTPAALDGSMGQCMWCWNAHYYTTWKDGNKTYEAVTLQAIPGKESRFVPAGGISWIGFGVMDRQTQMLCSVISDDARYRGGDNAFHNDLMSSGYDWLFPAATAPQRTLLGMPASNVPIKDFSTYARARGEGWEAQWFVSRAVVEYLIRIILGTRNSQATFNSNLDANGLRQGGLGAGATQVYGWDAVNDYWPFIPTSVGLDFGDGLGIEQYAIPCRPDQLAENGYTQADFTVPVPVFFGLVNPFGHLWTSVSGLTFDFGATRAFAYVAPSMLAPFNWDSIAGMKLAAEVPTSSGYIKQVSNHLLCAVPTAVGGTTATYFGDYFYSPGKNAGFRVRLAGGKGYNGTYAGTAYADADYTATYAHSGISSPLCYFTQDPIVTE